MNENQSKTAQRIAELTRLIESEPNQETLVKTLTLRAQGFHILGERVKSIEDYFRILDLLGPSTESAHARSMISLALLETGEKEQAFWWAASGLESDMDSAESYYVLGLNCLSSQFFKLAVDAFREALDRNADYREARIALARSLREEVDYKGSIQELEEFIRRYPDDPVGHYELGLTVQLDFRRRERYPAALNHYTTCIAPIGTRICLREI